MTFYTQNTTRKRPHSKILFKYIKGMSKAKLFLHQSFIKIHFYLSEVYHQTSRFMAIM